MKERIKALYKELDFLTNNAPSVDDCTTKENDMYYRMEELKDSILDYLKS